MRLLIIGSANDRRRLRDAIESSTPEIAGEFATVSDARSAGATADAILAVAPADAGDDLAVEELTSRELEVLHLLADGLPNKAIASRLDISDQTVKFHVSSIYGKLGAVNRADAVRLALRRGVLTL